MTIEYWNIIVLYSWTKNCVKIWGECESESESNIIKCNTSKIKNIWYRIKVIMDIFSKWSLFISKWAIFQQYIMERTTTFWWNDVHFVLDQHA